MSELATLARPYAAAVFKRAKETGSSEKWSETLTFLSSVLSDRSIAAFVNNPKVGSERLLALMLDICEGRIDQEGANFLKLLVQNQRLTLVPEIARIFEDHKAEDEGYLDVDVYAAYEFSEKGKKDFAAKLEKQFGKKVHMNVSIDKSLIGGVLVRAGDKVIDGSIKGQLQHMQKALQ
ncbi:MAG: F0F1 ATP synthase subunit delta [Gammaproteobacteria bacterium]